MFTKVKEIFVANKAKIITSSAIVAGVIVGLVVVALMEANKEEVMDDADLPVFEDPALGEMPTQQ